MRKMKYVLNNRNDHFLLIPDIGMKHSDARGESWTNAGFVNFDTSGRDECGNVIVKALCYGESVTLKLSSGLMDSEIITKALKDTWWRM
jgi:hypothetical protein